MEPYNGGNLIFLDDNADRKQEEKGEVLPDSAIGAGQSSPPLKQEQTLSPEPPSRAPVAEKTAPPPSIGTKTTTTAPMALDTPAALAPAAAKTKGLPSTVAPPPVDTTTTAAPMALDPCLENGDPNRKSRKDLRRKNRRRLHRLLKKPGALPSFLRVIEERKTIKKEPNDQSKDAVVIDDDSDDDFLLEPPIVVIDVDEYLGLKKKRKFAEVVLSASNVPSNPSVASVTTSSSRVSPAPVSSSITTPSVPDGWYEGSCSMAMLPEDTLYLTENQQFIRKNMEFFTATAGVLPFVSNRKTPLVVGRVGFRCLHCARALREGVIQRMPPASVSFPKNFIALYNLTIQKQQMHIDDCPHVPSSLKWTKTGAKPRKRQRTELPATVYWQIACKRLGIVELENNSGLRFGRDPKLPPLPFETIKSQVGQDHPELMSRMASPTRAISSNLGTASHNPRFGPPFLSLPRAVADVIQEQKREKEDLTIQLISKEEATMLSDFMLLTMQQATFCHAVTEDFATRGKKTRLMRLGYAGFCCRHCKRNYYTGESVNVRIFQNSCRSFSSSRDNVGSAMSNSFVLHLLKCDYTPQGVKHALLSLKKLHSKQMQRLPYGSQSQVFGRVWERIRAADKPIGEGVPARPIVTSPRVVFTKTQNNDDDEYVPDAIASSYTNRHFISPQRSSSRQPSIPPVDDKEYAEVLKDEEEHWEPSQNDNLIQRQDRELISDYVFLCMRQLKVTVPTGADLSLKRPRRMAGVCCRHCSGASNSRGGKSFPSAPDNIASILNVTIYRHMMSCPNLSLKLKRTIDKARKSHTQQCASVPYGSQRRYFEKLFARLSRVPMDILANTRKEPAPQNDTAQNGSSVYSNALQKCEFARTKISDAPVYWQCLKCRMVPYDYRAPGSIFFSTPSVGAMEEHRMVCQNDGICWDAIDASMKKLSIQYGEDLLNRESFVNLIRSVVGNEVCDTYLAILGTKDRPLASSIWRRLAQKVDFDHVEESFSLLRQDLNLPPASLAHCADFLKCLQCVSCNFQVSPATFSRVKTEVTPALEHVETKKSNDIDESTNPEYSSLDRFVDAKVPSEDISGEVSHSLSPKATMQDPHPKDDREATTISALNGNEETANQGLTWDQGINVMDNVEAGQFDDA